MSMYVYVYLNIVTYSFLPVFSAESTFWIGDLNFNPTRMTWRLDGAVRLLLVSAVVTANIFWTSD